MSDEHDSNFGSSKQTESTQPLPRRSRRLAGVSPSPKTSPDNKNPKPVSPIDLLSPQKLKVSPQNPARTTASRLLFGEDDEDNDGDVHGDDSDFDDEDYNDEDYKDALEAIFEDPIDDINDEDDPTEEYHECIVPPSSEDTKIGAVPLSEDDFATSMANHYEQQQGNRKKFAFSFFRRPSHNADQHAVYLAYLKFCFDMFVIVLAAGFAFWPQPHLADCYNYTNNHMCMNNKLSYVYWLFGKIGSTGNGFNRLVYYAKQYKDIANTLVEHALPIVSIDTLPANLQLELTERMLKGIKAFVLFASVPSLKIRQAVRYEMTGLPFATQLFLYSMMTDFRECVMLSGAIKLNGCLRRLYLSTLESGAQVRVWW